VKPSKDGSGSSVSDRRSDEKRGSGGEGAATALKRLGVSLGIMAALCLANWGARALAMRFLAGKGPFRLIGDFLIFFYARNTGAFLSLGNTLQGFGRTLFLVWLPAALVVLLLGYVVRPRYKIGTARFVAAAVVAAGGISNIAERVLFGSVVDYINAGIGAVVRSGVLNLADLEITVGIILFAFLKDSAAGPGAAGGKPE
jgi:signal peptidase II